MDLAITHWINAAAGENATLDTVMVGLTQSGVPIMVVAVASQWWSKTDRRHVRHASLAAGLSFLIGLAINQIILLFIHRIRPYDAGVTHLLIAPSSDWSFPSDHATASISVVTAFAVQRLPRRSLALFAAALLVCWSRIFVGTHYVSDIAGGAATGILAAIAVKLVYREGSRLDRFVTGIL